MRLASQSTRWSSDRSRSGQVGRGEEAGATGEGARIQVHDFNERAYKWGVGVSVMGASLSAQSGFSSNVDISLTMGHASSIYYIRGNDNVPTSSHRVFAGG